MRISYSAILLTAALAVAAAAAELEPGSMAPHHWIVVGTNGQLLDVDPLSYLPESRRLRKLAELAESQAAKDSKASTATTAQTEASESLVPTEEVADDGFFDDDEKEEISSPVDEPTSVPPYVPDIETLHFAMEMSDDLSWLEEDEEQSDDNEPARSMLDMQARDTEKRQRADQGRWGMSLSAPTFLSELARVLEDDSGFPAIQGSIIFAELSCVFVAFIGYLVLSIPLWPSFSRGQKCCLFTAFTAASLYQGVVVGWYWGAVPSDLMLGISSLITRMISLGMVPITTTSFMKRARQAAAAAQDQEEKEAAAIATVPHHAHTRHRHNRARSS